MRAMVSRNPSILEASVSEQLAPQVDQWLQGSGLGLTRDALGVMSVSCPEVGVGGGGGWEEGERAGGDGVYLLQAFVI